MAHTHTSLLTHLIFSTKDRFPSLENDIREEVEKYVCGVGRNIGVKTIAIKSVADHAHLLVQLPASASVSEVVGKLKANSSRFIHEKWPARKFAWQQGYGAFSVSRSNVDDVVRYIANQEEHHRTRTFQEEYLEFLKRYEIEYDELYVWS
ncbi:MAG: IS200/IS605 family transposase [Acidobacteriota bacterium]|nr:IS200/IS605 family transposase [Acidobacteriota bacterium]